MVGTASFWSAFYWSNVRVILAFVGAISIGTVVGLTTAWHSTAYFLLQPSLTIARYIPVAAVVPLSIVFLGVSNFQKIAVLFLGAVVYTVILIQDAVIRFPATHIESARSLGLDKKQILYRVVLPGISPDIYDAARVTVSLTWSYLLIAEIVAAEDGLGFLLMRAQRYLRIDQMFFLALVMAFTGMAYEYLFIVCRRRLFKWI
jgi:NitT/TauT family transport system permease protein